MRWFWDRPRGGVCCGEIHLIQPDHQRISLVELANRWGITDLNYAREVADRHVGSIPWAMGHYLDSNAERGYLLDKVTKYEERIQRGLIAAAIRENNPKDEGEPNA